MKSFVLSTLLIGSTFGQSDCGYFVREGRALALDSCNSEQNGTSNSVSSDKVVCMTDDNGEYYLQFQSFDNFGCQGEAISTMDFNASFLEAQGVEYNCDYDSNDCVVDVTTYQSGNITKAIQSYIDVLFEQFNISFSFGGTFTYTGSTYTTSNNITYGTDTYPSSNNMTYGTYTSNNMTYDTNMTTIYTTSTSTYTNDNMTYYTTVNMTFSSSMNLTYYNGTVNISMTSPYTNLTLTYPTTMNFSTYTMYNSSSGSSNITTYTMSTTVSTTISFGNFSLTSLIVSILEQVFGIEIDSDDFDLEEFLQTQLECEDNDDFDYGDGSDYEDFTISQYAVAKGICAVNGTYASKVLCSGANTLYIAFYDDGDCDDDGLINITEISTLCYQVEDVRAGFDISGCSVDDTSATEDLGTAIESDSDDGDDDDDDDDASSDDNGDDAGSDANTLSFGIAAAVGVIRVLF